MIRAVRKKLASSIAGIETVEDFSFNSWLRIPLQTEVELGRITSRLKDTKKVNLNLEVPESEKFDSDFEVTEILPELKNYYFKKIRSNAIFFKLSEVEQRGIKVAEVELKNQKAKTRNFQFVFVQPHLKETHVKFPESVLTSFPLLVNPPAIIDHLAEMVPEIKKVDLLTVDDIVGTDNKVKIISYDLAEIKEPKSKTFSVEQLNKPQKIYKVKIPGMGSYKSTVSQVKVSAFKAPSVKVKKITKLASQAIWSNEVQLSVPLPFKYFDINDTELTEPVKKLDPVLKNPQSVKDLVKFLLKKVQNVEWGKRADLQLPLLKYEDEGAKFLAENERALLMDEFGLDKEKEVISALKFLFANRTIRSALIISSPGRMGNAILSEQWKNPIGWLGKLKNFAPELSYNEIKGNDDERTDLWSKTSLVSIVPHSTLINDYHLKILGDKKLNSFDCIIIDETQMLLDKGEKAEKFLKTIKPAYLWSLSSLISKDFQSSLNELLNSSSKIENVKIRQKKDVADSSKEFIWHDDWLPLDEDQELEYKETLVDCQKDLRKILETGNPYRFQANIFTLLHKVKQVCNFSKVNSDSPKIKLLLEQVSIIASNKKKVVIFSQYDRMGIRKIEKAFESAGVKFVIAPNGYSVEEMSKAINLFRQKTDIVAFLTDAKISKLKFGDFYVPYIIKFDQWWNPLSLWETEDLFELNHRGGKIESINIFNYQNYGSLDQDIKSLLINNGLFNKNIFEVMPAKVFDDLVSVDDWLKIFKMPVNDEQAARISLDTALKIFNNCTLSYFRTMLSKFFFVLGFSNVDIIDEPGTSSFNLVGESKRNNRKFYLYARVFLDEIVTKNAVKDVMFEAADSTNSKIFIISKGTFEDGVEEIVQGKYILLDIHSLAKHLIKFNLISESDAEE